MAINDKRLSVTEFDFDDVKDNLKTFLKNQTEFTDYDFEGSGMSALLDVLAYNTHYLGFNANMLANEMFLDSASLRSSVVSHAKMLGYEVASPRAQSQQSMFHYQQVMRLQLWLLELPLQQRLMVQLISS